MKLIGVLNFISGDKYDGEWKDGTRDGFGSYCINIGVFYYANGNKYDGEWKNGNFDGIGINVCKV